MICVIDTPNGHLHKCQRHEDELDFDFSSSSSVLFLSLSRRLIENIIGRVILVDEMALSLLLVLFNGKSR